MRVLTPPMPSGRIIGVVDAQTISQLRNRLRQWRVDRGLTLGDVSDLTGLSEPMLSRVERGERQLAPLTRVRVARRLGVAVRDLFPIEELEPI